MKKYFLVLILLLSFSAKKSNAMASELTQIDKMFSFLCKHVGKRSATETMKFLIEGLQGNIEVPLYDSEEYFEAHPDELPKHKCCIQ